MPRGTAKGSNTELLALSGWYCVPTNQDVPRRNDLDQPRVGVDAHGPAYRHLRTFAAIVVVEFVTVTVALRNGVCRRRRDFRTLLQRTGIKRPDASCRPLGPSPLLLFHQVDHRMGRRLSISLEFASAMPARCREFDHGALACRGRFPGTESCSHGHSARRRSCLRCHGCQARGHEDAGHPAQLLGHILSGDLLRIDIAQLDLGSRSRHLRG